MTWRDRMRSFWRFAVTERMGYRRPSTITPQDHAMRQAMDERLSRLNREVARLDATRDVWSDHTPDRGTRRGGR